VALSLVSARRQLGEPSGCPATSGSTAGRANFGSA